MANFFKVGPVGGGGGDPFDEQLIDDGLELAGMNIRAGQWIDYIQPLYRPRGSNEQPFPLPGHEHGGTGGEQLLPFLLAQGEYVIEISGNSGNYIDQMVIKTSNTQRAPAIYGKGQGTVPYSLQTPPDMKWEIVSFFGKCKTYVDQLGVYVRERG